MSAAEAASVPANQAGHVPLAAQVGGHDGVMTTEDGSLLIKPAYPAEINFYQSVGADPGFAPLRPFIPKFYGTLKLEGVVDPEKGLEEGEVRKVLGTDEDKDMFPSALLLENLSYTFLKPNILDIKLGTILYDDDATPEKRARMEKTARESTSLETGVRVTGFQVYDLESGVAVNTPREWGRSLKVSELPSSVDLFFPMASPINPPHPKSAPPPAQTPIETTSAVPAETRTGTGLPPKTLYPILVNLREDIREIKEAVAQVHMRMVGASLLIIYEADWERAEEGLKVLEEMHGLGGDEEEEEDEENEEEEAEKKRPGPPYVVKLIDFAHTKITPGDGPDEGVLKGFDTMLDLLDQRINLVKPALP